MKSARGRGRRLSVIASSVAVSASAALLSGPVPAAVAAPTPRCQGQVATVVGAPGQTTKGTAGDDVIVSNGSAAVAAGAGDDVICLTGRLPVTEDWPQLFADAGDGDDRVTTSLARSAVIFVSLGGGADHFSGGRESDVVSGGDLFVDTPSDGDPDVIGTGSRGRDHVLVGDGGPLLDTVKAPSPVASVQIAASAQGTGVVQGGSHGLLTLVDDAAGSDGAWTLDLAARAASLDGSPLWSWTGFGRFVWAVPGTLVVEGTEQADSVAGPLVGGTLGDGDDVALAWSSSTDHSVHVDTVDGGAGDDELRLLAGDVDGNSGADGAGLVPHTAADITVDVEHRRARFSDGEAFGFGGFERYGAQTDGTATLLGSGGDDVLLAAACDLRVRGGEGDDVMRQLPRVGSNGFSEPSCSGASGGVSTRMSGGPGDDTASVSAVRSTVTGGEGDDRLFGGGGRDRILGGAGDDLLTGEDRTDILLGGDGVDIAHGGRADDTCRAEYGSTCAAPRSALQLGPPPRGSRPDSVRLVDARKDVVHLDDPRHFHDQTAAPGALASDIVAVRTTYRHRQAILSVQTRSLRTSEPVRLYFDVQYGGSGQFHYGDVTITVPARKPGRARTSFEGGRCTADLLVDRTRARASVSIASSCLGDAPWVRVAVRSYAADSLRAPTYLDLDQAPDPAGHTERFGPAAWAP